MIPVTFYTSNAFTPQIPKGGTQNTDWLIKQLKGNISEPFQATQVDKSPLVIT